MSDTTLNNIAHALDQDKKRERDHRHKWARGEARDTDGCTKRRPAKPHYLSKSECSCDQCFELRWANRKHARSSARVRLDDGDSLFETPEDVHGPQHRKDTRPAPDADYTYSFDAKTGPSEGSQVLSVALARAVDKYETKATERLVKAEYELVQEEKEDSGRQSTPVEDDFELL